jgi:hypothetical protein
MRSALRRLDKEEISITVTVRNEISAVSYGVPVTLASMPIRLRCRRWQENG